jgi:hypothetical protein
MAEKPKAEFASAIPSADDLASLEALRRRIMEQVELINRTWLDRWRDIHSYEMDIGAKLLASKKPEDALAIYNEWMGKRIEAFAADHQRFSKLWFDLLATAMPKDGDKK